jgi:hypothetical protein
MNMLFDEEHEYGYFEIKDQKNTPDIIQNCKLKKIKLMAYILHFF